MDGGVDVSCNRGGVSTQNNVWLKAEVKRQRESVCMCLRRRNKMLDRFSSESGCAVVGESAVGMSGLVLSDEPGRGMIIDHDY